MTIWEENGMSLEEYAKAFNKACERAWEEQTGNKVYFANLICDKPRSHGVIINVGE